MNTSDVLALIAIVVSVCTATATIYFQYFERRRVAVALGDEIYLAYGERDGRGGYGKLGLVLSLSLINKGACDALVTVITATVSQAPTGLRAEARWRSFYEPTEAVAPGLSSAPRWRFTGWVRPLAASSRKVVTEWIYFSSTPLPSALPVGEYVLELEVTETRPTSGGLCRTGRHHAGQLPREPAPTPACTLVVNQALIAAR